MSRPQNQPVPAQPGSLDREVASDLALLRKFVANRERHLEALFGRQTRQSLLRDEVLRLSVVLFGVGRTETVSYYVRKCSNLGTAPSVRYVIRIMEQAGLAILDMGKSSKSPTVHPTEKLITFYNDRIPRLRDDILRLLDDRNATSADHMHHNGSGPRDDIGEDPAATDDS